LAGWPGAASGHRNVSPSWTRGAPGLMASRARAALSKLSPVPSRFPFWAWPALVIPTLLNARLSETGPAAAAWVAGPAVAARLAPPRANVTSMVNVADGFIVVPPGPERPARPCANPFILDGRREHKRQIA